MNKGLGSALKTHEDRLAGTEAYIRGLVEFIAGGDQSDYVRQTLVDLEAQARAENAQIAALRAQAAKPIRLPSPEELLQVALDLEAAAQKAPARAREELRALFAEGRIALVPQPEGHYVAKSRIFPLLPLLGPTNANGPPGAGRVQRVVARGRCTRCTTAPGATSRSC